MPTPDLSALGPVDLLYHLADTVLNATSSIFPSVSSASSSSGDALGDFVTIVNWTEPFILNILLAQALFFVLIAFSRRRPVALGALFLYASTTVFGGRHINDAGRRHWPRFATQDYFDRQGLFMMIFISGPLLLGANVIVITLMKQVVRLTSKTQKFKDRESAKKKT